MCSLAKVLHCARHRGFSGPAHPRMCAAFSHGAALFYLTFDGRRCKITVQSSRKSDEADNARSRSGKREGRRGLPEQPAPRAASGLAPALRATTAERGGERAVRPEPPPGTARYSRQRVTRAFAA